MEMLLFGFSIHQHQNEQIQNQNRPGVHDNLHHSQEFSIEHDKESSHMKQKGEQGQGAMHGIPQRHS
jgi:hypothetical protein